MSDAVLVALIGLAGSAVGSLVGIVVSSKLTQYRLEQLEKKMDSYAEAQLTIEQRVYKLEEHNVVQDERLKVANHRIEDLEKRVDV